MPAQSCLLEDFLTGSWLSWLSDFDLARILVDSSRPP
jgi:hypothetical protein